VPVVIAAQQRPALSVENETWLGDGAAAMAAAAWLLLRESSSRFFVRNVGLAGVVCT
jgi:hypothetical protein